MQTPVAGEMSAPPQKSTNHIAIWIGQKEVKKAAGIANASASAPKTVQRLRVAAAAWPVSSL